MQCPLPVSDGEEVTGFTVLMDHCWEAPSWPSVLSWKGNWAKQGGGARGCPWGLHFALIITCISREVPWLTWGEPGKEISQAIRQLYLDIALLKRQKWPEIREIRDAAMISVLWGFHIKHTGHTRGLFTLSVGRRHRFNEAKSTKTINRSNSVIAKSPWLRAVLSMRLWILTHHQLPGAGQEHSTPGVAGNRSQAMATAPDGCEPKQSITGCPWTPHTLHSPMHQCSRRCGVLSQQSCWDP